MSLNTMLDKRGNGQGKALCNQVIADRVELILA
jgi:hypothetical protein